MIETDLKTAPQLLAEAADLIDEYGHRRVILGSRRDGFCVAGALNVAHHDGPFYTHTPSDSDFDEWYRAFEALADALGLSYDSRDEAVSHVVDWNNAEGRAAREVIEACRTAAANLREDT